MVNNQFKFTMNSNPNFTSGRSTIKSCLRSSITVIVFIFFNLLFANAQIPFSVLPQAQQHFGLEKDEIPVQILETFKNEYAIVLLVSYRKRKSCLTYDMKASSEIFDSVQMISLTSGFSVSAKARKEWLVQLNPNKRSRGMIIFGVNIINCSFNSRAFIDLTFVKKHVQFSGLDPRALNDARILEHEFLAHSILGLADVEESLAGENPGAAAEYLNEYAREMRIPERLNYSIADSTADKDYIKFLAPNNSEVYTIVVFGLSKIPLPKYVINRY